MATHQQRPPAKSKRKCEVKTWPRSDQNIFKTIVCKLTMTKNTRKKGSPMATSKLEPSQPCTQELLLTARSFADSVVEPSLMKVKLTCDNFQLPRSLPKWDVVSTSQNTWEKSQYENQHPSTFSLQAIWCQSFVNSKRLSITISGW